jgi:cell division transport system permease protein
MSRLGYFARETFISLRRNLMMTTAGIITVFISLFLASAVWLISTYVDHGTQKWKSGVELEIFLKIDATPKTVADVKEALEADTENVKSFRYLNHEDALKEFREDFKEQPALIESTRAKDLPESFRVVPTSAELTEPIAQQYKSVPGVDTVITAQEQVKRLLTATTVLKWGFGIVVGLLLLSSLFLIVNTIRLATFARRREIEVMKLVGASNWFVRVPFMAEGFVQGLIGAGFAVGFMWGGKILLMNVTDRDGNNLFSTFRVTNADALGIAVVVLLIGALIGTLGSVIGLRRFLDN